MALHRLQSLTIGVPDADPVSSYYREFGLTSSNGVEFDTKYGGQQLRLTEAATRRATDVYVGADDLADLECARVALVAAGHEVQFDGSSLVATEPHTNLRVHLNLEPRHVQPQSGAEVYNHPGAPTRSSARAPAVLRTTGVRPNKLGHFVVTSTDYVATARFFSDLIGFKVSDYIAGAGVFLRCSTDHHNLLVLSGPAVYLHHTAWEVDDVDDVGRGGSAMIDGHPERHLWGLGRHHAGSNFFWYLRDPAGNYSEYYADLDYIPESVEWIPESHEGPRGLYNWGPEPPADFLRPSDLEALMAAQP
jgi:hypothetical protein